MNSEFDGSKRRRSSFFGVLFVAVTSLFFSFFSFNSFAGDYKVDYAIDARGVAESEGPAECTYGRDCRLEFKEAHISIYLYFNDMRPSTRRSVHIYGAYFSDGESTKDLKYGQDYNYYDYKRRYVKLDNFEGRRRYGLEIVRNIKIGTIFFTLP
jgi:hypothetical protein